MQQYKSGNNNLSWLTASVLLLLSLGSASAEAIVAPPMAAIHGAPSWRDGSHDFDFLIGRWKAHLKRLDKPLTGSTKWIVYDGSSVTRKIWGDRANMEEFDVNSPSSHLHYQGQTLRLYNPDSHQWSIYTADAAHGGLGLPPTVGQFTGRIGKLYDYEDWHGRWIFVRYVWTDISATTAQMVQSFSVDGGSTWEANWICDLTREAS